MSLRTLTWIIPLALAALPATALAQETTAKYAEIGGWTVEIHKSDGDYMRCGAVAPAGVGSQTSFEKSREGWTLVVPTQAKGDPAKGSVAIDGKSFSGDFYPMADGRAGLFLKPDQLKSIQAGKALTIKIGAEQTLVPLDGMGAVFAKITECDKKNSR